MNIAALWDQLVDCICRPPRDVYLPEDLVGGAARLFRVGKYHGLREDLVLTNKKGQKLQCSHFKPKGVTGKDGRLPCVIYCHCNSGSRRDAEESLCILIPLGVSVFTLDFAGSGLSDGQCVSLGANEVDDVECVVQHLRGTGQVSTLGLWGRSMGAVTALLYSQRDPSIAGIVLDSPFSRLTELMLEIVEHQKLPVPKMFARVALGAMRRSVRKRAAFDINMLNPIELVGQSFIPALFGHANGDHFIKLHHSERLHLAYAGDKNFVRFEGDHNSARPEFWYTSVSTFFHNTLRLEEMLTGGNRLHTEQLAELGGGGSGAAALHGKAKSSSRGRQPAATATTRSNTDEKGVGAVPSSASSAATAAPLPVSGARAVPGTAAARRPSAGNGSSPSLNTSASLATAASATAAPWSEDRLEHGDVGGLGGLADLSGARLRGGTITGGGLRAGGRTLEEQRLWQQQLLEEATAAGGDGWGSQEQPFSRSEEEEMLAAALHLSMTEAGGGGMASGVAAAPVAASAAASPANAAGVHSSGRAQAAAGGVSCGGANTVGAGVRAPHTVIGVHPGPLPSATGAATDLQALLSPAHSAPPQYPLVPLPQQPFVGGGHLTHPPSHPAPSPQSSPHMRSPMNPSSAAAQYRVLPHTGNGGDYSSLTGGSPSLKSIDPFCTPGQPSSAQGSRLLHSTSSNSPAVPTSAAPARQAAPALASAFAAPLPDASAAAVPAALLRPQSRREEDEMLALALALSLQEGAATAATATVAGA